MFITIERKDGSLFTINLLNAISLAFGNKDFSFYIEKTTGYEKICLTEDSFRDLKLFISENTFMVKEQ